MRSALLLLTILLSTPLSHADPLWTLQQPDFETISGPLRLLTDETISLNVVRASFDSYEPRIVRAASFGRKALDVPRLGKESGALACVNGSFFDEQHEPLGLVISGGTTFHPTQFGGTLLTGVFFVTRTALGIMPRNSLNATPVLEALQAGPRLVSDAKVLQGLRDQETTVRSAVCIDRVKNIFLFAVKTPITLIALQALLIDPSFHCADALNLDGGSSSDMYFSPRLSAAPEQGPTPGTAQVPVALCLFARKKT